MAAAAAAGWVRAGCRWRSAASPDPTATIWQPIRSVRSALCRGCGGEANRTLSRLVVAFDESVISAGQVIAELDRVEHVVSAGHPGRAESAPQAGAPALPGDTAAGTGRMVALGADLVGLAAAATGRVLRLPRLPGAVAAAVTFIDTQPRLRRAAEAAVGKEAADVVLAVSLAAAQTLTQGPASLLVDVALRASLLAEARAGQQAWAAQEPVLAQQARCDEPFPAVERPVPLPPGPIEKYADVAAGTGLLGAGLLGVVTGRLSVAADAVLVAAPKATRTARESFAATLGCESPNYLNKNPPLNSNSYSPGWRGTHRPAPEHPPFPVWVRAAVRGLRPAAHFLVGSRAAGAQGECSRTTARRSRAAGWTLAATVRTYSPSLDVNSSNAFGRPVMAPDYHMTMKLRRMTLETAPYSVATDTCGPGHPPRARVCLVR